MAPGRVRIIGGEWRSRVLSFSDQQGLRPTPDRVRETLFNWLQFDVPGSRVLDCFAGSGALAFEAASRGASEVVMLENQAAAASDLQANMQKLNAGQMRLQQQDALAWLNREAIQRFDLVFLDPPYQSDLLQQAANLLTRRRWLANHAKIYVETGREVNAAALLPPDWRQLKSKQAGQVGYSLWQWSE